MGSGGEHAMPSSVSSFLEKRERFHLAYRLAARSYQLIIARSVPSSRGRWAAAVACAVGDIVTAVALRKSGRFALVPRLAVDAAEIALGSRGPTGLELATMPGVPLAMEAGLRMGGAGLVVPLVNSTVTGLVRRRNGQQASTGSFRYQMMAVALGAGIAAYGVNRRRVALARHAQDLEARIEVAHLAGQNGVATGADTVVDLLSRTTPLFSSGGGSATVGRMLADWRHSLAETTNEQATYLGSVLSRWQRSQNELHHDLAADVMFEVSEGHGTIVLTRSQATWLDLALHDLALRGIVRIWAADLVEARQPNRPRRIVVGDHHIEIPADRLPGLVPYDAGPLGFLTSTLWFADTLSPGGIGANRWAVGLNAAAGIPLAVWSHRMVARRGASAHARIVFAAIGHSLVHSALATSSMRNSVGPDGIQRFPALGGVSMLAMMIPLYWTDLDRSQQILVAVGAGCVLGVGLLMCSEQIRLSHLVAELMWPSAAFVSMATMRSQLESEADQQTADLDESDGPELNAAFASGRSYVFELVMSTADAARKEFMAVESELDERISVEVRRRLDEVDERLKGLLCTSE